MQGNQKVMLSELEAAAASGTHNPDGFLDRMVDDRCARLRTWAAECGTMTPEDTRLAVAT